MSREKVQFINSRGLELSARIELPDDDIQGYALFAHCFTCNKNLTAIRSIVRSLKDCGIAVLSFDFTGLGDSEGDFAQTNFSSNVDDLVSAAKFLEEQYEAPHILIGHSLGGSAVIFAAQHIPSIKAVATIGAPSSPKHVAHLLQSGLAEIEKNGEAEVQIGGRPFTIQKQFLDDINEQHLEEVLKGLKLPFLVLHSPQDTTVGIANAAQLYSAAWHPKSFISLDGADHLLTSKADALYVGKMIANWAERYIES